MGLVILAAIAALVRATSVRLPLRTFFKFTGLFLFALAVVFAGNGVFELQNAGILLTTHLAWMGAGSRWRGSIPISRSSRCKGSWSPAPCCRGLVMPGAGIAAPKAGPPQSRTGTTSAVASERSDLNGEARNEGRVKTDRSDPVLLNRPSPLAPRPS